MAEKVVIIGSGPAGLDGGDPMPARAQLAAAGL